MILHTFERLDKGDDGKFESDALGLFQDLAFQIGNESSVCTFLKVSQMSTKTSLELVEVVVMSTPRLFAKYGVLLGIVRDRIGPALAKIVSGGGVEFGVMVRAIR
jgi:Guanine nucleotide exchange factor in Golgi transport N-terminal